MRIASYNVENLFERAKAMNLDHWADSKAVLADYAKFNGLIAKSKYNASDKKAMLGILATYNMLKSADSEFFVLRENRGRLLKKATGSGKTSKAEIVANSRAEWIGWLDLKKETVKSIAIANTARVIADINPDVIGIVEAEDRPGLKRFNELAISAVKDRGYHHIMLIDGNDDRGIDVGIMTKPSYPIVDIQSHVDDTTPDGQQIFSRDCAGYQVRTAKGNTIWILMNHFKSKGYGKASDSDKKRHLQATRVRAIYDELVKTHPLIAVMGDFNDSPDSEPLAPLCGPDSPLKDVSAGQNFELQGRPGTFGNGTAKDKIDYILCSPALWSTLQKGGIWRKGVWGGTNGTLFPHYDTIKNKSDAASDHAAIWAEFDI